MILMGLLCLVSLTTPGSSPMPSLCTSGREFIWGEGKGKYSFGGGMREGRDEGGEG